MAELALEIMRFMNRELLLVSEVSFAILVRTLELVNRHYRILAIWERTKAA